MVRAVCVVCGLAIAGLVAPAPSEAAFPGPNGKIAFERADDIWTVDPDGTDLRNITFSGGRDESQPVWSPDGQRLAFVRSDNGASNVLFTANADGGEPTSIVPSSGFVACDDQRDPAWSPDGQKIAFSCDDSFDNEIWTINVDGTGLTRLTNEPGFSGPDEMAPAWSPDGTKIAYWRSGPSHGIWTMNPDGSGQAALITDAGSPEWSPDGERIAFGSSRDCTDCTDLWSMDRTGGDLRRLTPEDSLSEGSPSWSPDGQKIAFIRCPNPEQDPEFECRSGLFTMNSDGTDVATLVDDPNVSEWAPSWQAAIPHVPPFDDPAKIAFVSHRDHHGSGSEIYTMNSDGSVLKRLTFNISSHADEDPSWSPDGSRIAFATDRDGLANNFEIYVMNADGSGQSRLTNNASSNKHPTWSPDGTRIAYQRGDDAGSHIHVMNADGTGDVALTTAPLASRPDWSPDGSRIAYRGVADGQDGIFTMAPDGSGVTRLTTGDDGEPAWSPAGDKIAFSRPGAVWVMNADGTQAQNITPDPGPWSNPSWSPDGRRIAFAGERDIFVANADGTERVNLNNDSFFDRDPDFRGPTAGYPRPKSASPLRVSLVPAYRPCTTPNRTHGPPLGFDSCNPPRQTSDALTVGTPDANLKGANSTGFLRLKSVGELPIDLNNGDQSDVEITFSVTDVRNSSELSDYTGALTVEVGRRITDKDNTPHPGGPGSATVQDHTYAFAVPCSPTGSSGLGATCSLTTTADTLVPGSILERKRAIWQLGRVAVHDSSDAVFLTQGVFIP